MTGYPQALDNSRAVGDAVAALEAKVGIDSSTDTGSIDYKLSQVKLTTGLPHRSDVTAYVGPSVGASSTSKAYVASTVYAVYARC